MIVVVTLMEILGIFIFLVMLSVLIYYSIVEYLRERKCKHDKGVRETQACEALCVVCGKNLGFIGTWREKNIKGTNDGKNAGDSK